MTNVDQAIYRARTHYRKACTSKGYRHSLELLDEATQHVAWVERSDTRDTFLGIAVLNPGYRLAGYPFRDPRCPQARSTRHWKQLYFERTCT